MMWVRTLTLIAGIAVVKGGLLKIRVDDELKLYVDGNVVYNEFTIPRWQWEELAEISFDDNVKILALRMYNQGPRRLGYGKGEIDGKDLFSSGIVCKDVPKKQDPDAFFPGWFEEDYDDSDWTHPVAVESHPTEGIQADAQGFWGRHKSSRNVLCRLKLTQNKLRAPQENSEKKLRRTRNKKKKKKKQKKKRDKKRKQKRKKMILKRKKKKREKKRKKMKLKRKKI